MSKPINTKSTAEMLASSFTINQASNQNAENMKKLLSLLGNFEKTYSEPYQIPLSLDKTNADKIFTTYFMRAVNNAKLKYVTSDTFSAESFLQTHVNTGNPVQYVVFLRNHRGREYKLCLRIGDTQHALLGIGNDHFHKYLSLPVIQELRTTAVAAQQAAVTVQLHPQPL